MTYGAEKSPKRVLYRVVGLRVRRLERHRRNHPELALAYAQKIEDVKRWQEGIIDESRVAEVRKSAAALLDAMEATLADRRAFLVGDCYSLADLMATVCVARIYSAARSLLEEHPEVLRWYAAMRSRPSFSEADVLEGFSPRVVARVLAQVVLPWALPRLMWWLTGAIIFLGAITWWMR